MPTPTPVELNQSGNEPAQSVRWSVYTLIIALSLAVVLVGLFKAKTLASGNDRSRWCTVWSLVEQKTYQIDDIMRQPGWDTIDKVKHEGHFYSTKPALFPTLVAGIYRMVKVTTGLDLLSQTETTTRVILFIVNVLPFVFSLLIWCLLLERYAARFYTRLFLLTVAGMGTLLTPFYVTLNNHTIAAFSLLISLYALLRILDAPPEQANRPRLYFLAGFFAAFTCTNELPAALYGLISFFILVRHDWQRTAKYYVPAAIIPLSAFFLSTYLSTGGLKPFYMYYGTEKYLFVDNGIPSYWFHPGGIDKSTDSPLQYLWHCTIGHHGIFSLTPVFLLIPYGWYLARQQQSEMTQGMRYIMWSGLGLTIFLFCFYLSRTENYNYGGMTAGLRWTFWLIPFWIMGMIPACDRYFKQASFWLVVSPLLVVSVFSALYPLHNPWQHPWLFQWMTQAQVIDYSDPVPQVNFERQIWIQTLPKEGKTEWAEFSRESLHGEPQSTKLTAKGEATSVELTIERNDLAEPIIVEVDRKKFEQGAAAREMLQFAENVDPSNRKWLIDWLSGGPKATYFRVRDNRYLHTSLRPEAFRCLRATASLALKASPEKPSRRYYCMAWWTTDVPFGIVRFRQTVSDGRGVLLTQHVWQMVECSDVRAFVNPFASELEDNSE
ncbi:hypothetical protein Pla110_31810 [Polystyrenella longa]|uniref:Glycosyltransferase RgtA/B/C/D-like domain-containing protein n=1 Tax=Polystyrenella longa TaxID=2528007 RepID=A0A518CQF7_9PLAN|nr:hypothetical protein [Polystyrenella longa]QDU81440.1 hypothetical protein Pla110_31810 [Polystyrenella longa]